MDVAQSRRRLGRATFDVTALDLTDPAALTALGVTTRDLTSRDRSVCQELAQIAVAAGFDAVLGPSAASSGDETLAVFGSAIRKKSRDVQDKGVRTPPPS